MARTGLIGQVLVSLIDLTDAGRDRLVRALPVHLRGIADHFIAPLDADELAAIGSTLAKVVPPDRRPG